MATTTPNFGWSVPTSTDLVKDGATAIETLGDSIDASLVDLKGGTSGQVLAKNSNTDMDFVWVAQDDSNAIQNAIVDAKGDLIGATAADTPARLAVGTNGQVLTADSTAATGLAWATASAGGMTLLQTLSLSGVATVTSSSIAGTYNNLVFVIKGVSFPNGTNATLGMRFNADTGNNYTTKGFYSQAGSAYGDDTTSSAQHSILDASTYSGGTAGNGAITVYRYTDTSGVISVTSAFGNINGPTTRAYQRTNFYNGASAISSVTFFYIQTGGNWDAGTIYVYGVS